MKKKNRLLAALFTLTALILVVSGCNVPGVKEPEPSTEKPGSNSPGETPEGDYELPTEKAWVEYSHNRYVNTPFDTAERGSKRFLFRVKGSGAERVLIVSQPKESQKGWLALPLEYPLGTGKSPEQYWVDGSLRPSLIYKDSSRGSKQFMARMNSELTAWEEVSPTAEGNSGLFVDKNGALYRHNYNGTTSQYDFYKLSADEKSWTAYATPIDANNSARVDGKLTFAFDNDNRLNVLSRTSFSGYTLYRYDAASKSYLTIAAVSTGPESRLNAFHIDSQNRAYVVSTYVIDHHAPGPDPFSCEISMTVISADGTEQKKLLLGQNKDEVTRDAEVIFTAHDAYLKVKTSDRNNRVGFIYLYRYDINNKGWDKIISDGIPAVSKTITPKAATDSTGRIYLRYVDSSNSKTSYYTYNW